MALKNPKDAPKAQVVGMTWMVIGLFGAIFTGFAGIGFIETPLENPETVFIVLTETIFNPWVAGVLLAAILSAIMSTIDSQLLVCSSAVAEDFYRSILKKEASQKELVWIGRVAVLILALIATAFAANPESRVLDLVSYAWGGFGAAFGPVIILSLFWKKMTRNGALAGMITGAVTVIVWKNLTGGIFEVYEILPGFILCTIAIVAGSYIGQGPVDSFEEVFQKD
jgi:sodium/proline symporter